MPSPLTPAFVFDVNRCVGCRACEMACVNINQLPLDDLPASGSWREVRTFNELRVPGIEHFHLSMACNHCADAPCMTQCPARAYSRDAATGAVLIDTDLCLGCRYCSWVCPYDAPRFNKALGVMTKCTFCVDRQAEGKQPSCTLSCPTGALAFEHRDIENLTPSVVGFAQAGTHPAVAIVGLEEARTSPETHLPSSAPPWRVMWNKITPSIAFKHEWALAIFSWILAVLTGLMGGFSAGTLQLDWRVFLGVGILGMGMSVVHLGRKDRAWRAGLNLNQSWLSREIVLTGVFLVVATSGIMKFSITSGMDSGWLPSLPSWWPRAGLCAGLICLLSVDLVYKPAILRGSGPLHSAQTLMSGLMLTGAAAGHEWIYIPLAILKLILFWARQVNRKKQGLHVPLTLGNIRMAFTLTGAVLLASASGPFWLAFMTLALGEFLDRARFYDEIEIPTPDSLMLDDLASRMK